MRIEKFMHITHNILAMNKRQGWRYSLLVEDFPSVHEDLGSIPSNIHTQCRGRGDCRGTIKEEGEAGVEGEVKGGGEDGVNSFRINVLIRKDCKHTLASQSRYIDMCHTYPRQMAYIQKTDTSYFSGHCYK